MTPEQLDEIEKLAEADMSEPWSEAESAYVMALQRYALPLVKALREAREERDRRRTHNEKLIERLKETDVRAGEWLVILEKMESERDDARAEVERLRAAVRQVHALTSGSIVHSVSLCAIHKITKGMVE